MLVRFYRAATVLSALAASMGAASPALAQDQSIVVRAVPIGTHMVIVRYGDLNLTAQSHRHILSARVGRAVRNVCSFSAVGFTTDYQYCSRSSWAGARPQMYRAFAEAYRRAYIYR